MISGQVVPKYLLLKFGVGAYSQLGQPQELNRVFGNPNLDPQRGTTYVAGFESEPTGSLFVQGQIFSQRPALAHRFGPGAEVHQRRAWAGHRRRFLLRQKLWKGLFWLARVHDFSVGAKELSRKTRGGCSVTIRRTF